MREFSIKIRTATGLILAAISVFFLVLIIGIVVLDGVQPSDTSLADGSKGAVQTTKENFILGMAILGIGGTFGIIAYYYSTLGLGSHK